MIEIPAFVAYENPSNFNESNNEDEETAPNFENVSWTIVSKMFFVTVFVVFLYCDTIFCIHSRQCRVGDSDAAGSHGILVGCAL